MTRHRFAIEYLGTSFAGWQLQPGQRTVQGDLEKAMHTVLHRDITVIGSGRTDSGVHARGQVAHVDLPDGTDFYRLQGSLNAMCGRELAVRRFEPCAPTFHARYSAISRRYRYRIALRASPVMAALSWWPNARLNQEAMQSELTSMLGEHDFIAFCVPRNDGKSTLCRILRFDMTVEENFLYVHIEANRFLHKMVRSLVGAAVEVGRGNQDPGFMAQILTGKMAGKLPGNTPGKPLATWNWAPPQGLCLEKVSYADYDV